MSRRSPEPSPDAQEYALEEVRRFEQYGLDPTIFVKASNYSAIQRQIRYAKREFRLAVGFVVWFVLVGIFTVVQPIGGHRSVVTTICGLAIAAVAVLHGLMARRWLRRRREAEGVLASMAELPKLLKAAGLWR